MELLEAKTWEASHEESLYVSQYRLLYIKTYYNISGNYSDWACLLSGNLTRGHHEDAAAGRSQPSGHAAAGAARNQQSAAFAARRTRAVHHEHLDRRKYLRLELRCGSGRPRGADRQMNCIGGNDGAAILFNTQIGITASRLMGFVLPPFTGAGSSAGSGPYYFLAGERPIIAASRNTPTESTLCTVSGTLWLAS
jgi:hypothetical protein